MNRLLIPMCAAVLAGCATPTVFAPAGPSVSASGFWDSRIEQDRYRVSYRGGSGAPADLVRDYALLHAADITRASGYDWFRVVGRYGEAQAPRSSSGLSVGGGASSYGRRSASGLGVGFAVPLGNSGPQLTETVEIVLGKGAKPADPDTYDAADVQRSIRSRMPQPPPA